MSMPRNTMGIENKAVCELRINPMGACNWARVNVAMSAPPLKSCKVITETSTIEAAIVASTNFKSRANKAMSLFIG